MNKLKFLPQLVIAGIASTAALSIPIKAEASTFIIDDFNGDPPPISQQIQSSVPDGDPDFSGPGSTQITRIDILNTVMNEGPENDDALETVSGWQRLIGANLNFGDEVTTRICTSCQAGEFNAGSGGSQGWGYYTYFNNGLELVNLGDYDIFMFDYATDLDGANVFLYDTSFDPGPGGDDDVLLAQVFNLPSTGGSSTDFLTSVSVPLLINTPVDELQIRIEGVANQDFTIDNAKLVSTPEPGTIIGLLAISGLGLGLKRKKQ